MHDLLASGRAGPWLLPLAPVVVLVGLYAVGVVLRRERLGRAWSPWRSAAFVSGALLLGFAVSPALPDLVGGGARAHMAQHVLVGMLAPLGLVLGAPLTLLLGAGSPLTRHLLAAVLRQRVVRVLSHPAVAAVLHVGALFFLYLTPFYASTQAIEGLERLVLVHLLLAGYLYAWSIAGPDPAPHRPGVLVRAVVLVVAGGAHAFLAKLLYARADELLVGAGPGHSPEDARAAAQWMFYGGDLAEVLLAAALFTWWLRTRRGRRASPGTGVRDAGRRRTAGDTVGA